jgi:hypothetical protein
MNLVLAPVGRAILAVSDGVQIATVIKDVDIVYFDTTDLAEASEVKLTSSLTSKYPNVKWSVKNQARVHLVAHHEPYTSLKAAISRFPETATAVAVQLDKGALRIVAPLGLQDLFQLSIRANPRANRASFDHRLIEKKWLQRWPLLSVERAGNSSPTSWFGRYSFALAEG